MSYAQIFTFILENNNSVMQLFLTELLFSID